MMGLWNTMVETGTPIGLQMGSANLLVIINDFSIISQDNTRANRHFSGKSLAIIFSRSCWIPGSYASIWPEALKPFLRPLKNNGF
jgi:hypothetical protein